ncbi:putative DivIVA protein [Bifidobacterium bohemicum DSM 22767]|uniref:Putative DivIVA protein n=1 Tax=Bifidobacterium bohemicum DSM 22767 TaxID=1437606 RepID=A0A086ZGJ4_9BIFI|nr:DivIVA domain-containing protein [Bifidobacterium bohemicum]KFI45644.1 putative DivIVA protein [Bifidobacterium bohemicum DSM 22767]
MSENSLQGQQNASRFDCVRKHKWGYDPDQVDDFLEKAHEQYDLNNGDLTQELVQSTAFTFTRGGYVIAEVDAALARLEHAIVDRDTARQIASDGRVAWRAETDRLYQLIAGRGERPAGNRFNKGKHRQSSYDVKQVDRIVDQVLVVAADELGVKKMRPSESKSLRDFDSNTIANVIFTQRKGVHGYDEREVDYYLAVCSQLLSRVEAYMRALQTMAQCQLAWNRHPHLPRPLLPSPQPERTPDSQHSVPR